MASLHHKISKKSGFVYLASCHENGVKNNWYKIGVSKYDPCERIESLNRKKVHGDVKYIHFFASLNARAAEKLLHSLAECVSVAQDNEYFFIENDFQFFEVQFFNMGDIEKSFIRKCLRGESE